MVLAILTVVIISLNVIYEVSVDSLDAQARTLNSLVSINLDETFAAIDDETVNISVSDETQQLLRYINSTSTNDIAYNDLFVDWSVYLTETVLLWQGYLRSVGLVDLSGGIHNYGYSLSDDLMLYLSNSLKFESFDEYPATWQAVTLNEQSLLVLIRPVRDLEYLKLTGMGYLYYVIDFETLFSDNSYSSFGDSVVYSSVYLDGKLLYTNADHDLPISLSEGSSYFNNDSRYVISSHKSKEYNMEYFVSQDITEISDNLAFYRTILVLGIPILSVVILVIVLMNVVSVTNRIKRLTKNVTHAYDNNFKIDSDDYSDKVGDELSVLSMNFRAFTEKIDELVNEILVRKILSKEAQIRLFQSQINPHFLYNSLDTINALAQINDIKPISDMSMSIAAVMRYSLDDNILSDVETEIDILRKYLTVQKLRFNDRLNVEIKTCERCENIEIPRMIFQPFVENAIKYSAEAKQTSAHVKLNVRLKNNNLIITIIDNGIGLCEDMRLLLCEKQFEKLSGHGLKNTFLRLDNLFGDKLTVKIRTVKDNYTAIRIKIFEQGDFTNVEKS